MRLSTLQSAMTDQAIDAWLVHDFRNSNPTLARLLPPGKPDNTGAFVRSPTGKRHLTRRAMLFIPARGEPVILTHSIDASAFDGAILASGETVKVETYLTWQELRAWIGAKVAGLGRARVAMEYSPGGVLPVVGVVDAGSVEFVRSCGGEVVSSADLIQAAIAVWDDKAVESHRWASEQVAKVKDDAFGLIRERLRTGTPVSEWDVCEFIRGRFRGAVMEWPDGPIVAVNAHGADPHFETTSANTTPIKPGDFILLDLWARRPGDEHIYSDITWVAFAGAGTHKPTERHQRVFQAVKAARDAAVALAQQRWRDKQPVLGWELDDAARNQIISAGYAKFIRHRTGHSLSPGAMVHGVGVNIDNLETHDTRTLIPGIGFTIEPGIYIPDSADAPGFGVRLEINVHVDPEKGPTVTSCVQDEIVVV